MYRLNSSFDSFDTLQKLILSELENVFDDLADVMAKFNDVVQKTCWTFENEVGLRRPKMMVLRPGLKDLTKTCL